jgi:allantoinase
MSERIDLLVRGGTVITPAGAVRADIAAAAGRIVRIAAGIGDEASEVIDASGLHVIAGIIDSHVHFNEPGRTEWEGIETGSGALAAGGGTASGDRPGEPAAQARGGRAGLAHRLRPLGGPRARQRAPA